MRFFRALGLRARLAVALAGLAALAVGLATLLEASFDELHLIAAVISAAAALVLAFLIAQTLSRPLRRIKEGADSIAAGDLATRVELRGGPELRAVGDAINRLAETLQHEEELRKESVANLAHELRTPVSGLLSRIEAAQDGVLEDEAANLEAMHAEALRLTRLLDDLARLADAERPDLLIRRRPVDLTDVGSRAAEAFQPRFVDAGVVFTVRPGTAVVAGDAGRLDQIAGNLLSNALRYTPSGGHVELSTFTEGSEGILEVRDTGVGIPAADQARVFERFWRGDRSRSRETGGAGIGLAIVKELVRAHGGRVELTSAPDVGSRFRVVLPATREVANERPRQRLEREERARR